LAVQREAEQAIHLPPPGIQLAGRMCIGVDADRLCADALQAHRLPHQQILPVRARSNEDQVARYRVVNRNLQSVLIRVLAVDVRRWFAAKCHCHRIDRLFAVRGRDDQLAANRQRLTALLQRTARLCQGESRHVDRKRHVAP
jgi:hypothetical protein